MISIEKEIKNGEIVLDVKKLIVHKPKDEYNETSNPLEDSSSRIGKMISYFSDSSLFTLHT